MAKNKNNNPTFIFLIISIVMISILVLIRLGFFDFSKELTDIQLITVYLTFISGLISVSVTVFGLMVKNSIDHRTLQLTEQTNKRLASEENEREHRLKLEASLSAIDYLSSDSSSQIIGSLMALTNLGQLDLSLALLNDIWPKSDYPIDSVVWIINKGLEPDNIEYHKISSYLLKKNASYLMSKDGRFSWPINAKENINKLSVGAQFNCLIALIKCLLSIDYNTWDSELSEYFNDIVTILFSYINIDSCKLGAAKALIEIAPLSGLVFEPFYNPTISLVKNIIERDNDPVGLRGDLPELFEELEIWLNNARLYEQDKKNSTQIL